MTSPNDLYVIFGTGPVGLAVMNELVTQGQRVRLVNRSGQASAPAGVEVVAADAFDPAQTRPLCQGAATIYNCTNPPYHQWPELFPRLQAGVLAGAMAAGAKLVSMENVYMYGPTGGRPLTEDLPYAAQTRKGSTRAKMAEELLKAHQRGEVRVTIGRASDFFGPGVLNSAAGERVFRPALAGKMVQVLGNPDMPHTYTYVPDIGRALAILGQRDEALGRAWHLPSAPTVSNREFLSMVFAAAGHPPRIQAAPKWLIQALGLFNPNLRELVEMMYEFEEPFIVDHSQFRQTFGDLATPLPDAIRATLGWFRQHPR